MNIETIGRKLVRCDYRCEGVTNKPEEGIRPRCLIFEDRPGRKGTIVVGINPGKAKESERNFYLKNNNTYAAVKDYWNSKISRHPYYRKIRELLLKFDFDGPILWTELVKCQCSDKNGIIPIQTMRTCINIYLKKEIELLPNYTIFGVGNIAFEFCALSFPHHFIIGVPHPTGSYGNFSRLSKNIDRNEQKYLDKISERKGSGGRYKAIKIFD